MKQTCLLMVIGMPRTFRKTYEQSVKTCIIDHNVDFEFDIITHVPVCDASVHDAYAPLCKQYYTISNDLRIEGAQIDIPYLRVLESYKYVHEVLQKPCYDVYMWIRFDVFLHNPVSLCELNHNVVCSLHPVKVGLARIQGDVHDRDWDYAHIGNHKAFSLMVDAVSDFYVHDATHNMYRKNPSMLPKRPQTKCWQTDAKPAYTDEHGNYIGQNVGYLNQYSVRAHIFQVLYQHGLSFDFIWGEKHAFLGTLIR